MNIQSKIFRHLRFSLPPLLFFMQVLLLQPHVLHAEDATITDFTVTNSETNLLLYLKVSNCFTEEMETAIQNGIPVTFTFYVDLTEKRPKWPDRKIISLEFNHVIEYDSLKKEYLVRRDEIGSSKKTASLDEAKRIMSELNGFKVLALDALQQQASYALRVKAKLARKNLPLYFHYLIPFSSPWDFETEWHELSLRLAL